MKTEAGKDTVKMDSADDIQAQMNRFRENLQTF